MYLNGTVSLVIPFSKFHSRGYARALHHFPILSFLQIWSCPTCMNNTALSKTIYNYWPKNIAPSWKRLPRVGLESPRLEPHVYLLTHETRKLCGLLEAHDHVYLNALLLPQDRSFFFSFPLHLHTECVLRS